MPGDVTQSNFVDCRIAVVTALVGFSQSMLVAALYKYRQGWGRVWKLRMMV